MPIFDLFSKRQKRLRGEIPEIFTYDQIPNGLRVKIVHIIKDMFGEDIYGNNNIIQSSYESIQKTLCREYGLFELGECDYNGRYENQVLNFFLKTEENDKVLDVIELTFKYADRIIRTNREYNYYAKPKLNPDDAISELNDRFKEEGIGYSFDGGEIIRVDSTYTHSEITKPTISLLWNRKFQGANEEYLKAHEHYRHGRNKECLAECSKALESVMKTICKEKGWEFKERDTARKLIQVCFQNELVPSFTQNQFTSLQNLLESGIPTIRNKLGGHGQGQTPQIVDDEMTRYGLNLTGTNIIFLIKQSGIE
ncbi:STM4504/CBY_0614 family protein [Lacihabitans lacunae]|uniref:STM4504/CBY_0614 family protein n=1 Tax=Lacihabitans lacunae TaxID=1028214 RepID=A0ABV7YWM6_9BACT